VNLEADRVADLASRPLNGLTRRDVALALLTVPSVDAAASLPGLRRGMLAAGNPLSAVFWSSAETILQKISDGEATVGDVRTWLEATGTEPNGIIGLHVWDEQPERSQLAAEMHTRLISHLEDQLAAGLIDPDLLAVADPAACRAYIEAQERWMTSPLADGRVPMDVLLDEKDEEFLAEWDAADAEALAAVQALLDQVGDRPLPHAAVRLAAARLRQAIAEPGWPGRLLTECSGLRQKNLPADDAELWLRLAAGVASPQGTDDWAGASADDASADGAPADAVEDDALADDAFADDAFEDDLEGNDESHDETDSAIAAICAIDHFDWLAVITALAEGGSGTPASAADLAAYVRDYDPDDGERGEEEEDEDGADFEVEDADSDDDDDDDEFDEVGMEDLFVPVTTLWQLLGAIDDHGRLTPLGWWGLPEAMRIVWAPADGTSA
jgi:hypothetical protein